MFACTSIHVCTSLFFIVSSAASPDLTQHCSLDNQHSCGASLVQRGIFKGHINTEAVRYTEIRANVDDLASQRNNDISSQSSQSLSAASAHADAQRHLSLLQQKAPSVRPSPGPKAAPVNTLAARAKATHSGDSATKVQPSAEIVSGRPSAQLLDDDAAHSNAAAENSSYTLLGNVSSEPAIDHAKSTQPAERHEANGNIVSRSLHNDLMGDALVPTEHGGHVKEAVTEKVKEHEEKGKHLHTHRKHVALIFFIGVLVIGILLLLLIERFTPSVPYTVALFVAGALASIVHKVKAKDSMFTIEGWFDSIEMWQDIEPHLLFFAFLPPLLFGEAMRLNVQLATKCFGQVFLLACPGVVIGSVLTALVAMYILPYGWGWPISMVFGAILSATDPVAVVALFHSLGVSPRLSMIVSGESLLNDGTAIVLFQLMLKWLCGAELTAMGMLTSLAVMVLPALAVGAGVSLLLLGVISICAEGHRHSDIMIQVVVTISCGYLAFMVAEEGISASGVLATVVSGYVIAYYAWPRFVDKETVETVWETIEFIGNTVIFFLAGVMLMDAILARWSLIQWIDFGYLLALYIGLTIIRSITLAVLWIPLNAVGTPFTLKEGIVMVHSALRGAVSLALAIIVDIEPAVSTQMGTRVMFHVGGIAALTFLVNATTAAPLLRYLGLTKTTEMKERVLHNFEERLAEETCEEFDRQLRQEEDVRFKGANSHTVIGLVPSLQSTDIAAIQAKRESAKADPGAAIMAGVTLPDNLTQVNEAKQMYREIFLRVVQNHYWTAIKEGVIPKNLKVARILLTSTNEAFDSAADRLGDWDAIVSDLQPRRSTKLATTMMAYLAEMPPFSWSSEFRRSFASEFDTLRRVWVALSFQEAHRSARKELPTYFGAEDFSQLQADILKESEKQCQEAQGMLDNEDGQSVEFAKSEMLARRLLNKQLEHIHHMTEKGLLQSSEAHVLEHKVILNLRSLTSSMHAKRVQRQ